MGQIVGVSRGGPPPGHPGRYTGVNASRAAPVHQVDQHYTAEEVAKLLNVQKSWVYEHRGELGGIKLSSGCVRYPESKIIRRLQSVSRQG